MTLEFIILAAGLTLIVLGANWLVDGASTIARKARISEFVIGMTIVGMGTSMPEFVVSIMGAIKGNADIAVGNVIGSNIFNTAVILGITAFILPMRITRSNKRKDIPLNIFITLLLIVLGMNHTFFGLGTDTISRLDGIILLVLFTLYIILGFKEGRANADTSEETESAEKGRSVFVSILMVAAGLGGLIYGGNLFVDSATAIAKMLHISDKVIAITVLAGGTSLPELATCIVAAFKKKGDLALGNILGSNIFNILLILGGASLITPLSFASMNFVDLGMLLGCSVLIFTSVYIGRKNELDRVDGLILILADIAYMAWMFNHLK